MLRRIGLGCLLSIIGAAASAQAPSTVRAETCVRAITLYATWSDVPVPHDTLKLAPLTASVTTEGSVNLKTVNPVPAGAVHMPADQILQSALERAAAVGATGLLDERSTANGRRKRRFVPLFVPADSSRVAARCTTEK